MATTPYSDAELERLRIDVESDLVERKESFKGDAPTTVREAVCAFANDLPNRDRPGVVFIGARNDGSPAGLAVSDELLRTLADVKADGNTVPPPTLTVAKHVLGGAEMAVLTVWPADSPPVRFKGRIYIRVGPRRGITSAQDERILNEKRRHRDRPFDVRPVHSASAADLDAVRYLAEAMRVLGYVQKFGGGIVVARGAMQQNGNPPLEFRVEPSHVMAIVRRAP